ncbi:MAG TPA: helix-turn-helix domain-containing protein [Nitriliruptoraceae bacterium]|nr:helix-turn-helix domain-containing protein [Nitriliruptoraceae bacterium]
MTTTPPGSASAARHRAATRSAILEASTRLFLDRRGRDFTTGEVADRAEVTRRTVYRYFSTREDLLRETVRHVMPEIQQESYEAAETLDQWIAAMPDHFAWVEEHFAIMRGVILASMEGDDFLAGEGTRHPRDDRHWNLFRDRFPHLDPSRARADFALLRQLTSSITYLFLRGRFGLDEATATATIVRQVDSLLHDLGQADVEAAGTARSDGDDHADEHDR